MIDGSFLGGLQHLVQWMGNLILPTLAGLCVIIAIYEYSQRRDGERYFVAALLCLLGPACAQLVYSFVTRTPPSGGADVYASGLINAVNWLGNVILPIFAAYNVIRGVLVMGGFMERFTIGDDWTRYFIVAFMCLMVSGIMRLLEHFVLTAHSVTSLLLHLSIGGAIPCLYA